MKRPRLTQGFTFVELLIAMSVTVVAGGGLFTLIHATTILAAKNTAINVTHQQARQAIHESLREIHGAVSIPQLTNAQLQPLTGASQNGPAAGVSYQVLHAGPYLVFGNTSATSTSIQLDTRHQTLRYENPTITDGYRLIIPAFQIEKDILQIPAVTGMPQTTTIQLKSAIGAKITCEASLPAYVAYITRRSALVVSNGQLHRYSAVGGAGPSRIVARDVTSPTPFTVPSSDNRYVQVQLVSRDRRVTSRGFRAVDLQMNLTVPYRFRLTTRQ